MESVVEGSGIRPERVPAADAEQARKLVQRDGAVVLSGLPVSPDSVVVAAAYVLGARLRQLFPVRHRGSAAGGVVAFHNDSFNVVVDVAGVPTRLRDPNEDYVLIQAGRQAAVGGESVLADGYLLADRLRDHDPELYAFLTGSDVDYFGAWSDLPGVPKAPYVCRHIEWTRAGRRIVRINDGARPLPRDPDADRITRMRARYAELAAAAFAAAPRTTLAEGEILLVDNYRCWHGRDPHQGDRLVHILTLRTDQAM